MAIERRYVSFESPESSSVQGLSIERRAADDGAEQVWLTGYAALFGSDSVQMDDFVEQISPDAFRVVRERRGRKKPLETRALVNHDPNHVIGRYPSTLRMKVDDIGLRYEVLVPTSRADIVELVERGDIRGSSFSFTVASNGESWSKRDDGQHVRTITEIEELYDVGPVTFPAYAATESLEIARRSLDRFKLSSKNASIERQFHEGAMTANEVRRIMQKVDGAAGLLKKYGHKSRR